jgi:hypothetical protein
LAKPQPPFCEQVMVVLDPRYAFGVGEPVRSRDTPSGVI